jgi:hypothetical protein
MELIAMQTNFAVVLRKRKFRSFMAGVSFHERRYFAVHGRPKAIDPKADVAALVRIQNRMWLGEITHL